MNFLIRTLVISATALVGLAGCSKKTDGRPGAGMAATPASPAPAQNAGPGDGGGGTDVAFDFQQHARQALEEIPRYEQLKELNVKDLEATLNTAKILVTEKPIIISEGSDQQEVVAKNDPDSKVITIHGSKWKAIYSLAKKESLALHELLGLMRIESSGDYKWSQKYYEFARPKASARFRDVVRPQVLNDLEGPRIVLTVFADLLSPFYYVTDVPALHKIIEDYGDKVQIVVRNFPITVLHGKSEEVALAGICAAAQGKFRLVHDAITSKAKELSDKEAFMFVENSLDVKGLIRALPGVDMGSLETCMSSADAQIRLDQDMTLVDQLKLIGAPHHLVTSKYEIVNVPGARSYEDWKKILDKMLARNTWD